MIIVGAKGLAKEILQIIEEKEYKDDIYFFDDVNLTEPDLLYNKHKILRDFETVENIFEEDNRFVLGLGVPKLRKRLCDKFEDLGGRISSLSSSYVYLGNNVSLGKGYTLMSGVKISNSVKIGKALLAYYNVLITHDVTIGDFVELSPGCILLGHVEVEDRVHIGAGAIVLPKLKIGKGAVIGAGAIVTKDVPAFTTVVGNPARKLYK